MEPNTPEPRACSFCSRAVTTFLELPRHSAQSCPLCATRLGRFIVDTPLALAATWPILVEQEDDDEPEPKVRMPDGRLVELRERTAELKQELPLEARLQLASNYAVMGLYREQLLECGYVLSMEPELKLAELALQMLLESKFTAPDALKRLRETLFPS